MYAKVNEYKDILKSNEQEYDVYLILQDGTKVDADISGFRLIYTLGEKIIGNFVSRRVEFNLFNTSLYNITNKEFEVFVGLKDNNAFNYISLGKFIANKPETKDEKTDECSIIANDYSLKFKTPYKHVITFPCTVSNAIKQICEHLNIEYIANDFINANFLLEEFFIDEDANFFQVIKALSEAGFANAHIVNSNSLIVKSPSKSKDYTFDLNEIFELKKEDNKFGPLNAVVASRVVADDGSTTEDVYARNEESITQNGIYEYKIIQNDAIDYDRQTAVNNMLAGILNFEYVPATIETVYNPAAEVGDLLEVPDAKTDTSFLLYAKEITADLASGLMTIESTEKTKTETDYTSATAKDKRQKTEYKVNKMEGEITQLISKTDAQSQQITSITADLNGVETRVSSTETKIENAESAIEETQADVQELDAKVDDEVSNLQSQIDGTIQFWNGSDIPTLSNEPASLWTTEEEKNNHRADLYTVIEDVDGELKQGKSYRFDKVGTAWTWVELTDNELSAVQALAASKAKVFVTTPKPSYNVGDLWLKDKELYECQTAKDASGVYAESDWVKATKYTDDTAATLAQLTADQAIQNTTLTSTTGEAKEFHIENSADSYCKSVEIYGESTQETRSGKNLLPFTDKTFTLNGITYTCVDGELTLSGTSVGETYATNEVFKTNFAFTLLAGTYTFQLNLDSSISIYTSAQIKTMADNTTLATVSGSDIRKVTFTLSEETELYLGFYIYEKVFDNLTLNMMLESGNTTSSYQHAGAKPSSKYKSAINSASKAIILKSTGRNQLPNNYQDVNKTVYGITYTVNTDGSVTANGTATGNATFNLTSSAFDLPAGKYKLVGENEKYTQTALRASYCSEDGATKYIGSSHGVFTVVENDTKFNFYIVILSGETVENVTFYPMLLLADETDLTFERGKESITTIPLLHDMRSLPDGTRDRIYWQDGKWYDEQNVNEAIISCHAVGTYQSFTGIRFPKPSDFIGYENYGSFQMLCECAKPIGDGTWQSGKILSTLSQYDNAILFPEGTTLEEAKTLIDGCKYLYQLKEPIITEITDPVIIEALEHIRTFAGITNITSDAFAKLTYYTNTALNDEYETKLNANKQYTQTVEKFAEQDITNESIIQSVSEVKTTMQNDYATKEEASTQYIQLSKEFEFKVNSAITDLKNNGVSKVVSSIITIDENGLTSGRSDSEYYNVMNNTGNYQYNAGQLLAKYDKDGAEIPRLKSDIGVIAGVKHVKENVGGVIHHKTYVIE